MIEQLSIANFQSHKDSSLDFDKGVNVIIGGSDTGKTAILRALRWLITNRPSGDSFRSNWGGKTSIEMFTDNAHIVRSKDKENEYILGDSHFKAFATDVPKEIQDALNISEINISNQFDAPFLLSDTSGEVAQYFNKIAKLDKIDQATNNVNSAIRELEQGVKYKTAEIEKQEEQIKEYDYIDKMEAEVEALEEINKQYVNLIQKEAKLENLIVSIKDNRVEIKELEPLLALEEQVNKIDNLEEQKYKLQGELEDLGSDVYDYIETEKQLKQQERLLKFEIPVNNLLQLQKDFGTVMTQRNNLFKLFSSVKLKQIEVARNIIIETDLQTKFDKEMGSVCILCGQVIKK